MGDEHIFKFLISKKKTEHLIKNRYIVTKRSFIEKLKKTNNINSKITIYSKIVIEKNKKSLFAVPSTNEIPIFLLFVKILANFIKIYLLLLTLRICVLWLPKLSFRELDSKPLILLRQTEPFLKLFS